MKQYQKLYTENLYAIGLTQYPGALIINKRFANIPPGAPIFLFNWAEDNIIRERVYVPADKQQPEYQLQPETLPGAPGLGQPAIERDKIGQGGASPPCPAPDGADANASFSRSAHPRGHPRCSSSSSMVTFTIIHSRPGDYGDFVHSMLIARGASTVEAQRAADATRKQYGLNDPAPVQYVKWIGGIVTRGDFGYSFYYNRPVRRSSPSACRRTILLALTCHILASLHRDHARYRRGDTTI